MNMQPARAGPDIEAARLLRVVPLSLWPEHVIARRRRLKRFLARVEPAFHAAIEELDALTPDADAEPSLGASEYPSRLRGGMRSGAAYNRALVWAQGCTDDREADAMTPYGPVDADDEASLGSAHVRDQRRWAPPCYGLLDGEHEHDGREPVCEDEGAQCDDEGVAA